MEYMIFAKILANVKHYFLVIQPILRIFSFFFVAIPAFSTAVSSGIVSVFVCVACIVAGGICWHKYKSLQKDHRSYASVNPNLPLTGSPKANATSAAQTKTKNDFIPAQNPSAVEPQKIIAQPTRPGKSVIKNAISSTTKNTILRLRP